MAHDTLVSTSDLAKHLDDPLWVVIDCRFDLANPEKGAELFADDHIAGARYASLDRDLSSKPTGSNGRHPLPDPNELAMRFAAWGIRPESQIVAYDESTSMFACRLWWLARQLGYQAAVLDGGLVKWRKEGLPIERGLPPAAPEAPSTRRGLLGTPAPPAAGAPTARTVRGGVEAGVATAGTGRPGVEARSIGGFVTAEDVERLRTRPDARVIDSRAAERFRGEVETIDRAAGHIPGAVNRFFQLNLNADGTFKSPEDLRAAFSELLQEVPPHRCVIYCGSGVTACHNLLALELAGLKGAQLYPGSWSEWSSDPTRPVAKG